MNSALKPVGVPTSPAPPQLNKPLHQQNATTYGQPMSHIPQNLVNLPHSTTPANAHTNNIHTTNHYSVNTTNVSQPYAVGGSTPPPSNHPVANQSSPPKNSTYSSNTNNVVHSYKIPVPTVTDNTIPDQVSSEGEVNEKPKSNGTSQEKPVLETDGPLNHQEIVSIIKDKPLPPSPPDVPESCTPIIPEKPSAITKPIPSPEKPVEIDTPTTAPVEQESQSSKDAVEAITPETLTTLKPVDLPVVETATDATPTISEPVTPVSTVEASIPSVAKVTDETTSDVPAQVKKTEPDTSLSSLPEAVEPASAVVSPPVSKPKEQNISKPPLKLATTPRSPVRKNKLPAPEATEQVKITKSEPKVQKSAGLVAKTKRARTRTQPYQSPLPEVEMISKISSAIANTSKTKKPDDKLIVFYKNEFLAVRNPEGGFYLCQALHNIYKSSRKLRILWLSQDKNDSDVYTPDFYDHTDFDCILTNINLARIAKGKFKLPDKERIRTDSILKRALAVEKGDATPPCPTEEHPDGLDLSLYKEESQLKTRKRKKRKATSPLKTSKRLEAIQTPDQTKIRKIEPKPKPPPVPKSLFIKKALAVKAKETTTAILNKPVKTKSVDQEVVTATKTSVPTAVDQKKTKVFAKVIKKPAVASPPAVQLPSTSAKPLPPRKQSVKSVDTVVPFLRKEPPVLKKEVSAKKEYLVLKKESALKKEVPLKKEIPTKRNSDVTKKDVAATAAAVVTGKREMPVLKKEAPIVKKEGVVPKQAVLTRKSNRGKK